HVVGLRDRVHRCPRRRGQFAAVKKLAIECRFGRPQAHRAIGDSASRKPYVVHVALVTKRQDAAETDERVIAMSPRYFVKSKTRPIGQDRKACFDDDFILATARSEEGLEKIRGGDLAGTVG